MKFDLLNELKNYVPYNESEKEKVDIYFYTSTFLYLQLISYI